MASVQAAQTLCAFLLGASIGLGYDIYRLLLPKKPGKKSRLFFDSLWWLAVTVWTLFWLYRITWGELRFTVFFFLLLGIAVYLYYFSPVIKKLLAFMFNIIKVILSFILRLATKIFLILTWPLVWLSGFFYRISAGIFGFGHRQGTKTKTLTKKLGGKIKKRLKTKTKAKKNSTIDHDETKTE